MKFYNKTAIIRDHGNFEKIIALLESIDKYNFNLTLNSSLLNTWPNSTLMLAGYWTPALKNNPLYNNNPQVAEAVDIDDTEVINDYNKSEESCTSSTSSSFIDSEFFRKLPTTVILDEDTKWNILMNQPSTSYTISSKDLNPVVMTKENISDSDIATVETNKTVNNEEEEESPSEIASCEPKTEPNSSVKEDYCEPQSFYELLESYNSRENNSFNRPKVEDLYKQLVPKIIEEQYFNDSKEPLDSVSKIKLK